MQPWTLGSRSLSHSIKIRWTTFASESPVSFKRKDSVSTSPLQKTAAQTRSLCSAGFVCLLWGECYWQLTTRRVTVLSWWNPPQCAGLCFEGWLLVVKETNGMYVHSHHPCFPRQAQGQTQIYSGRFLVYFALRHEEDSKNQSFMGQTEAITIH